MRLIFNVGEIDFNEVFEHFSDNDLFELCELYYSGGDLMILLNEDYAEIEYIQEIVNALRELDIEIDRESLEEQTYMIF